MSKKPKQPKQPMAYKDALEYLNKPTSGLVELVAKVPAGKYHANESIPFSDLTWRIKDEPNR